MAHTHRRASADRLLAEALQYASHDVNLQQQMMKSSIPRAVWDCGSTIYDSFELFAFSQQLNRAIVGEGVSPSARIVKVGRARSLSMPHFATTPTSQLYNPVVKEDEPIKDIDFSHNSQFNEALHPKARNRFGVPKIVQRLFSRAFHRKGRDSPKSETRDEHGKVGRSPSERMLCFAQPLIKVR